LPDVSDRVAQSTGDQTFAFAPVDHHYSDKAYDRMYFMPLKEVPVEVEVSLLAGDGGYSMDQRTFQIEIDPELRLTELTTKPNHSTRGASRAKF
jgi:hypothetical protein